MSILTKPPGKPEKKGKAAKPAKPAKAPKPSKAAKQPKPAKGEAPQAGRRRAQVATASVNLLSPWVLDEIRVRKLRSRFLVGALVLALLMGAGWAFLRMSVASSETDLAGERAVADGLTAQIGELSDVQTYVGDVGVRTTDVEDAMARELAYSRVLEALAEALPAGRATYTTAELTLAPDAEAVAASGEGLACPGPDPFGATVTVGCVVLTGSAVDRDAVSDLIEAFDRNDLFVEPFVKVTSTEEGAEVGDDVLTFEGSLGLSEKSFSNRYADIDGSEDDSDSSGDPDDSETTP